MGVESVNPSQPNTRFVTKAVCTLVGVALLCGAVRASQASTAKTVWDGVYTEEQAKRGDTVYRTNCATCHGTSLEGGEMAGGLVTPTFLSNWNGTDLGQLFDRIKKTMPDDKPGILTRAETADVLAFVLSSNKFPAGKTELPQQTEVLAQIKLVATKQ
jgi:mono/diheme cytochrome c family protein